MVCIENYIKNDFLNQPDEKDSKKTGFLIKFGFHRQTFMNDKIGIKKKFMFITRLKAVHSYTLSMNYVIYGKNIIIMMVYQIIVLL
jgi:hypothetical protein